MGSRILGEHTAGKVLVLFLASHIFRRHFDHDNCSTDDILLCTSSGGQIHHSQVEGDHSLRSKIRSYTYILGYTAFGHRLSVQESPRSTSDGSCRSWCTDFRLKSFRKGGIRYKAGAALYTTRFEKVCIAWSMTCFARLHGL